ncbi:hypothetical protein N2P70_21805 [Escherichia coli]|nr:hypothetical protein [Escherichia coli]
MDFVFFLMIRVPPRFTLLASAAASDVYKRQGCILAAEKLEKMLKPGFMSENIRLSVFGVTEMREVYRDIIFGAPDGELPEGFEFVKPEGQEVLL